MGTVCAGSDRFVSADCDPIDGFVAVATTVDADACGEGDADACGEGDGRSRRDAENADTEDVDEEDVDEEEERLGLLATDIP